MPPEGSQQRKRRQTTKTKMHSTPTKIKNRYGIVFASVIVTFSFLFLIVSIGISSFIYEPNIVDPFYMFAVIFFPAASIVVGVIIIIKL